MIVIYPFFPGDQDLALKNATWINELGGCHGHQVVACYDVRCNSGVVESVGAELLKSFDKVYRMPAQAAIDGWPQGANYFFRLAAAWLAAHPEWPCFLWIEPDAIPVRTGWLDALEGEYKRSGRLFMGDRVQVGDIPLHMSGVGIYPNPLHAHAGEAYRASDIAWDIAAKDQIVPNAHFTDLIEHAWKHPKFTSNDDLRTQIAPQTILFHSSKDGSLIDLLRQKNIPVPVLAEPSGGNDLEAQKLQGEARESTQPIGNLRSDSRGGETFDIFIRTYPGDYDWLFYCLQSIWQNATGFRKVWIVSPQPAPVWFNKPFTDGVQWKTMNDESPDGYLAQQITKLYADVITDYQPDYILHVDSDVVFTRHFTPDIFFENGQMLWYYTPFEAIETPWKPIVEKFIRQPVAYEFMRSMPFMIPRWLYPKIREYCHATHGVIISDYVRMQPQRAFSEFNIMGAYAYRNHTKAFKWVNTLDKMPQHVARQFRSWESITPEMKTEIEAILGGTGVVHTPKTADLNQIQSADPVPSNSQIKELPNGIWVLEGDKISQWVEQERRLDHDQNFLPSILPHIKEGDTVVDVGAFIGDHTIAYAKAVGVTGMVYAFEPNPMAFKCLGHNVGHLKNVRCFGYGLSDRPETVPLSGNNGNWGGAYIGDHMKITDIRLEALETEIPWGADFIKIDVEGYELKVLRGAGNMINQHHPVMVIEINYEALKRQGTRAGDIYEWLENHGYDWKILQENCVGTSPMYDILCRYRSRLPEAAKPDGVVQDAKGQSARRLVVSPAAPPPAVATALLSPKEKMVEYVTFLKSFAEESTLNRMLVRQRLTYAGLNKKVYKRKTPR